MKDNHPSVEWQDLMAQIDAQMQRMGWTTERGKEYLLSKYGVKSRVQLTDEQIFEFLAFLQSIPTPAPQVGQKYRYQGVEVTSQ